MSKQPSQFDDYPAHGVVSASAALVTAWSALENFHSELAVVGGLAIYFHTQHQVNPLYRPTPTLAMKTLEQNFTHPEAPGPTLAASFYLGQRANLNSTIRLREDLVTVALALLNS